MIARRMRCGAAAVATFVAITTMAAEAPSGAALVRTGIVLAQAAGVGEPRVSEDYVEFAPRLPAGVVPSKLALAEAIRAALEHDPDLLIEAIAPKLRAEQVRQAEGAFDPRFEASTRLERIDTMQNTLDFVSSGGTQVELAKFGGEPRTFGEDNLRSKLGLSGLSTWGTRYEIAVTADKLSNDLSRTSASALFDPEHEAAVEFTVTQPLARNYGPEVQLAQVRVRRANQQASEFQFKQKVLGRIGELVKDYYDLLLAFQDFKTRQAEVGTAAEIAAERREQLERGAIAPSELHLAETEIARAYERFLLARQTLLQVSLDLSRRMGAEGGVEEAVLLPVSGPAHQVPALERGDLLARALETSPAYRAAQRKVEGLDVEVAFRRDQTRPEVDLEMKYGLNGVGNSRRDAFDAVAAGTGTEYSVGVSLRMPIGNREARGRLAESRLLRRQAELEASRLRHEIMSRVDKALASVRTHGERVDAVRRTVGMAERNLSEERDRLEKGQVGELAVRRREQELREARLRELTAVVDLEKSLAELWKSDGTLLTRYGVEVE